jgi:hypothetical protein
MQITRNFAPAPPFALVAMAVILSVAALAMWPKASSSALFDPRCEAWDARASGAFAGLIGDRSAIADAKLGDALFRLRRARKYCRLGMIGLARSDYDSLARIDPGTGR